MERKKFIKKFAIGGSILLTAPVLFNSCSDDSESDTNVGNDGNNGGNGGSGIQVNLDEPAYSELANVGGYAYKNNIIIFRTSESSYLALSKVCTHSNCTITYDHDNNELPCPCHGSKFSINGNVTKGPALLDLKKYNVSKNGNILTIT